MERALVELTDLAGVIRPPSGLRYTDRRSARRMRGGAPEDARRSSGSSCGTVKNVPISQAMTPSGTTSQEPAEEEAAFGSPSATSTKRSSVEVWLEM